MALWPVQIATHRRIFCICWYLDKQIPYTVKWCSNKKFKIMKLLLIIGSECNNQNNNVSKLKFIFKVCYYSNWITTCIEKSFRSSPRILPGLYVYFSLQICLCFPFSRRKIIPKVKKPFLKLHFGDCVLFIALLILVIRENYLKLELRPWNN